MPSDSSCSPYTAEIIDSRITISGRSARDQEIESMENKSSTIMMKKKTEQLDRTNYLSTLMHMLNGFIGSGILSMPITFKNGGLILASVMNPMIGILSCHCIHMLIQINELSIKIDGRTTPLDYHEVRINYSSFHCVYIYFIFNCSWPNLHSELVQSYFDHGHE